MAIKRSQQIAIWAIAIVLTLGTIGSFFAVIYATENQKNDQARLDQLMKEYQAEYEEYSTKLADQKKKLAADSYEEFSQYRDAPAAFDAESVTELKTTDLKVGDGEEVAEGGPFLAFYIGWNPSGKMFDSSFDGEKLKEPIDAYTGGVIEGWLEGAKGMKKGGIRELTIPAELAYGDMERSEDIPPNTPLKFIIFIPKYETLSEPLPSDELLRLHTS